MMVEILIRAEELADRRIEEMLNAGENLRDDEHQQLIRLFIKQLTNKEVDDKSNLS